MDIHTGLFVAPQEARGAVVAIGNFDGIHLGHRAVISYAMTEARLRGAPSGVLTFHPHPRRFFAPVEPRFELAPLRSKARHLFELGVEHLYVLPFDNKLRSMSAAEFVEDVLVGGLGVSGTVVGSNFRFGTKRQGDVAYLREQGDKHGFTVDCVSPVCSPQGDVYSSSNIRQLLKGGRPREARQLLGRSWGLHGEVATPDSWAQELGLSVALDISEYMLPRSGAYMAWVGCEGATDIDWRPAIAVAKDLTSGQRQEPCLALSFLDNNEGTMLGRMWVSFEEYLDTTGFAATSETPLQQWRTLAAAFMDSKVGHSSRPPAVSLERARQMSTLDVSNGIARSN